MPRGLLPPIEILKAQDTDPLFLQIKEATHSVLEPYLGASEYRHHGQRVVAGQRMIQAESDIFLDLVAYAEVCGWALAFAHARSGDAAVIIGFLGTGDTFDKAITHFATDYADQTERDYKALVQARKERRIIADLGL